MDKRARKVVRERVVGEALAPAAINSKRSSRQAAKPSPTDAAVVAGVTLSHPDKMFFPERKLRKRDIAEFYAGVSSLMVPHLRDRPLSLVRCPDGWNGQCFYQKHAADSVNRSVRRILVPEGKGHSAYLSASTATAIVGLVQWGAIEMHPWGSRGPKLDRPDRLIFDFDPDDAVEWGDLVTAVRATRALLEQLGLTGFLKTTGGKGLHVVVPIRPVLEWDRVKTFAKAVADLLASNDTDRFTSSMSMAQRKNRIFVDYLRNAEGATAIAPFSVRARANAPVSTPIAWGELAKDVRFDHFNVVNIPARLARLKNDPWSDFFRVRQTITRAAMKRVGAD